MPVMTDESFEYQDIILQAVMNADKKATAVDIYNEIAEVVNSGSLAFTMQILHQISATMQARKKLENN